MITADEFFDALARYPVSHGRAAIEPVQRAAVLSWPQMASQGGHRRPFGRGCRRALCRLRLLRGHGPEMRTYKKMRAAAPSVAPSANLALSISRTSRATTSWSKGAEVPETLVSWVRLRCSVRRARSTSVLKPAYDTGNERRRDRCAEYYKHACPICCELVQEAVSGHEHVAAGRHSAQGRQDVHGAFSGAARARSWTSKVMEFAEHIPDQLPC